MCDSLAFYSSWEALWRWWLRKNYDTVRVDATHWDLWGRGRQRSKLHRLVQDRFTQIKHMKLGLNVRGEVELRQEVAEISGEWDRGVVAITWPHCSTVEITNMATCGPQGQSRHAGRDQSSLAVDGAVCGPPEPPHACHLHHHLLLHSLPAWRDEGSSAVHCLDRRRSKYLQLTLHIARNEGETWGKAKPCRTKPNEAKRSKAKRRRRRRRADKSCTGWTGLKGLLAVSRNTD